MELDRGDAWERLVGQGECEKFYSVEILRKETNRRIKGNWLT